MQTPVFLILFLAPVYVPLTLLTGWIHAVASVNPITAVVDGSRTLLAGAGAGIALAFVVAAALAALLARSPFAGCDARRTPEPDRAR